ncbi:hypothetical protein Tco_0825894 [Tanacetum coccineum]
MRALESYCLVSLFGIRCAEKDSGGLLESCSERRCSMHQATCGCTLTKSDACGFHFLSNLFLMLSLFQECRIDNPAMVEYEASQLHKVSCRGTAGKERPQADARIDAEVEEMLDETPRKRSKTGKEDVNMEDVNSGGN